MNNNMLHDEGHKIRPLHVFSALFLIFAISALLHGWGAPARPGQYPDVSLMREPYRPGVPLLKVVLPAQIKENGQIGPYGPGMDRELMDLFLERHDYKVRHVYAESYDEAMFLLQRGSVDLMVGFGSETSFKAKKVGRSPAMTEFYPVLVVLPDSELRGLDLSNVHFNKVSYSATQLAALEEQDGRAMLIDPSMYALLMPVHTSIKTAGCAAEKTGYYWFWNQGKKELNAQLAEFWNDPMVGAMMAEMGERYYGFIPDEPQQRRLHEISRAISENIGVYSSDIAKAAAANNIDPLLLSAVIFQESRFNPKARSYTGVRGIMQLTMRTADMLGVDRMDPEQAIMGGARYLRKIYDSLSFVEGMSDLDKWFLTLAGFNQGPTVMRRAVRAAIEEGSVLDWPSLRAMYPSLHKRGLASPGFRPDEAVSYVENIRYYYYILSGLSRVGWPERQNLAGLFAAR